MFAGLLKDGFFATKLLGRGNRGGREEESFQKHKSNPNSKVKKMLLYCFPNDERTTL